MKRAYRLLLLLALCLAIPVQGIAALMAPAAHCPMAGAASPDAEAHHDADGASKRPDGGPCDCCEDADIGGVAEPLCKAGQGCHPGGVFAPLARARSLVMATADGAQPPSVAALDSAGAYPGIWRPPARA